MRYLMEHAVLPYLRQRLGLRGVIRVRNLHTAGVGESMVDSLIADLERAANPTVGLSAHPGQTDIRITAKADSDQEAQQLIAEMETEIRRRVGEHIYGADGESLEGVVLALLAERGKTLAAVELGTGGAVTSRLSAVARANQHFKGGLVAPEEAGLTALGLQKEEILAGDRLAAAAAHRVRASQGADWGLAVLPGANDSLAYIALDTGAALIHCEREFSGRPAELIMPWIVNTALDLVRRALL
jgi:nicotinamide mononucleotide (NMN) deamidase PncC